MSTEASAYLFMTSTALLNIERCVEEILQLRKSGKTVVPIIVTNFADIHIATGKVPMVHANWTAREFKRKPTVNKIITQRLGDLNLALNNKGSTELTTGTERAITIMFSRHEKQSRFRIYTAVGNSWSNTQKIAYYKQQHQIENTSITFLTAHSEDVDACKKAGLPATLVHTNTHTNQSEAISPKSISV